MTLFTWGFASFGIKDAIDVLIVTLIIYEALKLMKGTRSAQIIVGLFLIAGVASSRTGCRMRRVRGW